MEKSEYALHQNSFNDNGYAKFLSRPFQSAMDAIQASQFLFKNALDYGCGPTPLLAALLATEIDEVAFYDPLFFPNLHIEEQSFDLITCTEAIEHFHQPGEEWQRLNNLLSDSGVMIIMTKRVLDRTRFANWHYKNDPTHVCFFSEFTFSYLAQQSGLAVSFPSADIAVFKQRGCDILLT